MTLQEAVTWLTINRLKRGIPQVELAKSMPIAQSAVSNLENNPIANRTVNTIERYAKALGYRFEVKLVRIKEKP